jgi:hypothetical protein
MEQTSLWTFLALASNCVSFGDSKKVNRMKSSPHIVRHHENIFLSLALSSLIHIFVIRAVPRHLALDMDRGCYPHLKEMLRTPLAHKQPNLYANGHGENTLIASLAHLRPCVKIG